MNIVYYAFTCMLRTVSAIVAILRTRYDPSIALHYTTPFELVVAVILSAQCTDKKVNEVTAAFFPALKSGPRALATMPAESIERYIRQTGFYHAKAQNIKRMARVLLDTFNGNVPETMKELLTLPGVARKSANVILGELYHKSEGVVVDTHVKRIAQRLRLVNIDAIGGHDRVYYDKNKLDYVRDAVPEKIENELMNLLPKVVWNEFPHLLVKLGRDACTAQRPNCSACVLITICPVRRTYDRRG